MTTQSIKSHTPGGPASAIVSIVIALAVAAIGGLATASSVTTWYVGLHKPAFNPPNAVFGPVWTILYVLMAIAAWRVWRAGQRDGRRRGAIGLYAVQLALNLAWSLTFFGLRRPDLALADIALLLVAVLATTVAFWRRDHLAGLMMVPYVAWVAFASMLNFAIWRLN